MRKTKRDPRVAADWPVLQFPYRSTKRNGPHPNYHESLGAAKAWLHKDIAKFRKQFAFLNNIDVVRACEEVDRAISSLGVEGGTVDLPVDPLTQVRYHVELTHRKQAP